MFFILPPYFLRWRAYTCLSSIKLFITIIITLHFPLEMLSTRAQITLMICKVERKKERKKKERVSFSRYSLKFPFYTSLKNNIIIYSSISQTPLIKFYIIIICLSIYFLSLKSIFNL